MKTILLPIVALTLACIVSTSAQTPDDGAVLFRNRVAGLYVSPVFDVDGTKLSGANFWGQLYSATGLTATATELLPVGVPLNFHTSQTLAGTVQGPYVQVTPVAGGPASVQMRAWSGPFPSYEAAKIGGGRYGASRVLRFSATGKSGFAFPPNLVDDAGPIESFSLVGPPLLSINDVVLSEGTNGNISAVFTVTLTPQSAQTVTVTYAAVDGTATAGSDFVATNGTLTFTAGQTNKTISVSLTPDPASEPTETFTVVLANPTNAGISRSVGTATIAADVIIMGLSVDVAVNFTSLVNRKYALEKSSDPQSGIWTAVSGATNITGNGGVVTALDKSAGCNPGVYYYRVRIVQ